MQTRRQLKVREYWRQLKYGEKLVPQIQLSGNWLEEAGFTINDFVTIEVDQDQLIIKKIKHDDPAD